MSFKVKQQIEAHEKAGKLEAKEAKLAVESRLESENNYKAEQQLAKGGIHKPRGQKMVKL